MTSALFGCGVWKSCSRLLTEHPLCAGHALPLVGLLTCDPLRLRLPSTQPRQRAVHQSLTIAGKRGRGWLRFGKLSSRSSRQPPKCEGCDGAGGINTKEPQRANLTDLSREGLTVSRVVNNFPGVK